MNTRRRSRLIPSAILAALITATPVCAATWTWNGSQGDNSWNNSGNWTPASPPANDGTADIIFAGTTRLTPDLTLAWNVKSLTFNNTAGAFNLISTAGNTLTIGAGGITKLVDFQNQVIHHPITLSAAQTWSAASDRLFINGAVNNGGNLLTIDPGKPIDYPASIIQMNGMLSGGGGLTKNGPGELQLHGANTYTGTTTINAGRMNLSWVAGQLAIPGTLNIGDGVGTALDYLSNANSEQIADTATVNIFSTGVWELVSGPFPRFPISETITNLNIVSTGSNGGGVVYLHNGSALTILGTVTMTGGMVLNASGGTLPTLRLNGALVTTGSAIGAGISSGLDLNNGTRNLTVADGGLSVTGVVSNGAIIKDGPGALWLSNTNTYSGGTTLNAGTIVIGGGPLSLGTGPLTANGGTLRVEGGGVAIANAVNGTFGVDLAGELALNSPLNGAITKHGFGTLVFVKPGAVTDSLTVNAGTVRVDVPVTFTGGLTNSATVLFGVQTLTVNGAGLNNKASLSFAGGTLAGTGPVVNDGLIEGTGAIGGTGGFTNNAQVTVNDGNLTLSKTGANANAGNIEVTGGLQLRLTGSPLANTGTVDLAGGIVSGTALLSNNSGGTVSGSGLIWTPFANAGGTLRADGGTMNITSAFANSGVIRLDDGAGLVGGAITNTGRIQGDGSISNALTNSSTGSIRVDAGDTIFFTGAFAANAGQLNLQGGTLDFPGAINNSATGFITGRGALYTAGLTNNGQMAFSGGYADLHGDVSLTAGSRVVTSGAGSVTTFWDDVTHNGTEIFTGVSTSTVFFGSQSGSGPYTGSGTIYFIGDLRPGSSPASINLAPQVVFAPSNALTMEIGGRTAGPGTPVDNGYDNLVFTHASTAQVRWGGTLVVELINGFTPAAGDAFDVFDFDAARAAGTFSTVTVADHGLLPPGLAFNFDDLYTTGIIRVVSTTGTTFAQWAATELGDPAATPGGDHDRDGVPNGIEFALGLFPLQPGTNAPSVSLHTFGNGRSLRVVFTRPLNRTGVTLTAQGSSDLVTWTDLATSVNSVPFTGAGFVSENRAHPLSEPGLVEVRDIVSASVEARRYLRILVTLAP